MKRVLSKYEFVPLALKSPGIRRVNHRSDYCLGDSNSMLVETKENGDIAAHCFRCGSGGFHPAIPYYQDANAIRKKFAGDTGERFGNLAVGGLLLPDDSDGDVRRFPREATDWLAKAGLTSVIIEREQFLWSDEAQALYIPARIDGDLAGYVKRKFGEAEDRYRTLKIDKTRFFGYYKKAVDKHTERVVLVEDILSGLRCQEVCDTIAVLGTNLSATAQTTIIQGGYKEAVIFLDADNPTVRSETRRMKKKLPFLKVRIVETGKDPKYYTKDQLETLINDY